MIPVRASGLLRTFAEAGVLAEADVHVALRLARLGPEASEVVLLAAALAVRGVRTGSVCVALATVADEVVPLDDSPTEDGPGAAGSGSDSAHDGLADDPAAEDQAVQELPWPASWHQLEDSPLVAVGPDAAWRPLRLVDGLLYLDRYWQQEQRVRRELDERSRRPGPAVDLSRLDAAGEGPDRQRLAVAVAAGRWVSVLTGGPGTGKTTTVARLLQLLHDQPGPPPRTALAAPTGKAAARLQESVQQQAATLGLPADLTATTLHRLLGRRPDSRSRFRHDAAHRLPHDVVVVDESSMVSLTMMCRLLEALRPTARLVLVGDPDQLTPVEAGAVLSDLVHRPAPRDAAVGAGTDAGLPAGVDPRDTADLDVEERRQLRNGVVRLTVPHRFGAAIAELAEAVRVGDADRALELLHDGDESAPEGVALTAEWAGLQAEVTATAAALTAAAAAGDADGALELLATHRLLCAHRHGPYGVSHWNAQAARWSGAAVGRWAGEWPAGTPLLVTANDRDNDLSNGDTGVVVRTGEGLRAAFARAGAPRLVALSRLADAQPVHAMTVHRSQGSQYDAVTVLLPTRVSAILTRELLYTAVTRARRRVRVVGPDEAVRAAVERPVVRASGLRRVAGGALAGEPPSEG